MPININWNVIKALFLNTLKKEMRSKTLIFFLCITICLIFVVNSGVDLVIKSFEEENLINLKSQKASFFYWFISLWSTILAMIFGVDTIKSDLESGITPLLLAQPIKRWWYLLTRIIGSSAMVFSYYLLSFLMAWIIFFVSDGATNVNWSLIGALLGTCLVIVAVITISAFFTLFMGKLVAFVLSFILIGIINLGNTTFSSIAFSDHFRDLGIAKILGLITYYFFPRIGLWSSLSSSLINGSQPDFNYAIELAHYSVTIFILFFLIAIFFQKREM